MTCVLPWCPRTEIRQVVFGSYVSAKRNKHLRASTWVSRQSSSHVHHNVTNAFNACEHMNNNSVLITCASQAHLSPTASPRCVLSRDAEFSFYVSFCQVLWLRLKSEFIVIRFSAVDDECFDESVVASRKHYSKCYAIYPDLQLTW